MFKKQKILWTDALFLEHFKLKNILSVKAELESSSDTPIERINANTNYPMYKNIGGINIEIGNVCLYWVHMDTILNMLNDLFPLNKKMQMTDPLQDIELLKIWTQKFHLETPNLANCKGYILNNELVFASSDFIQFKYKDGIEDTFLFYQLFFIQVANRYGILIKKTF